MVQVNPLSLLCRKEKQDQFQDDCRWKDPKGKKPVQWKAEPMGDSLRASLWRKNFSNIVVYKFGANQNEFIADEVFIGRPKNHHNIWVFDREERK